MTITALDPIITKPKVLIVFEDEWDVATHIPEWSQLKNKVTFVYHRLTNVASFQVFLAESDVDCLWVTDEFVYKYGGPMKFYEYLPETLRLIVVPWVGCEFLDSKLLNKEKNITVCNIGPNAADTVSEVAIFLAISISRMTSFWETSLRYLENGSISECKKYLGSENTKTLKPPVSNLLSYSPTKYENLGLKDLTRNYFIGGKKVISLNNKKCLILGFGNIGQCIAKKLKYLFNMEIKYYKRSGKIDKQLLGFEALYCKSLDLYSTWEDVDFIVLALPDNPYSLNIINKHHLSMCKQGVRIINVGRGSSIDEDDLIDALDSGKVAACGLDVFKNEHTYINEKLLQRWDVTILPHIGSTVADLIDIQTRISLQNIDNYFFGEKKCLFEV